MNADEIRWAKEHGELELRSSMLAAFPQSTRRDRDSAVAELRAANRKNGGA